MPTYVFHLYDGAAVEPLDEVVTAGDLDEARDLARLRLLLSAQFTHIEVFEDGALCLKLERDGPKPTKSKSDIGTSRRPPRFSTLQAKAAKRHGTPGFKGRKTQGATETPG